jgi:release factor glutamine methyltransferase
VRVRDALASAIDRLDAEILLAEAIGGTRAALIADPARALDDEEIERFTEFLARRRAREPVAYILGRKGFRTIELAVDPRVLVPRPETEHVVEAALDLPAGARVVDVGTGSGAIALALKAERPDLDVVGVDTSAEALEVAGANAARLGLAVELRRGDLLGGVDKVDAIVSNPPYVRDDERASLAPEILEYEPASALFAGPDGLDVIRRLVQAAGESRASFLALEVGLGQAAAVADLAKAAGFLNIELRRDLAGIERVVVGRRPDGS